MRLELTRVGLLVELANHYTTRGAYKCPNCISRTQLIVAVRFDIQIQQIDSLLTTRKDLKLNTMKDLFENFLYIWHIIKSRNK